MQNKKLVHEFKKNATEMVRVELKTFQEVDIIDIRVYYNPDDSGDEWKPSKKGVAGISCKPKLILNLKSKSSSYDFVELILAQILPIRGISRKGPSWPKE